MPGLPKPGRSRSQFFFLVRGLQFGDEECRVLEDSPRQQPGIERRRLDVGQGCEGAVVLESEAVGEWRTPLGRWPCHAIDIVGWSRAQADVIERPRGAAARHLCFTLPDAGDGAKRGVGVIRVEIENRLEENKRYAVEANGIVVEPRPGEARVLAAAKAILLGAHGIRIVEVAVDDAATLLYLGRPVRYDLAVDPRDDLGARIDRQVKSRHRRCPASRAWWPSRRGPKTSCIRRLSGKPPRQSTTAGTKSSWTYDPPTATTGHRGENVCGGGSERRHGSRTNRATENTDNTDSRDAKSAAGGARIQLDCPCYPCYLWPVIRVIRGRYPWSGSR